VTSPPPNLHALAQRELAIPGRYQLARVSPSTMPRPWWQQLLEWMAERWQQLWNVLFSRVHLGRSQAVSIGDLLLVLVGVALVYAGIRLIANLRFARTAANAAAEPLAEAPAPRSFYKQACTAANAGEYGRAALLLFAGTIVLLDRRGDVALRQSATVGDVRRALRARNPSVVLQFDAIAAPFVQTAYAERPIAQTQWDRARSAFEALWLI
jgi:hypothetical protein